MVTRDGWGGGDDVMIRLGRCNDVMFNTQQMMSHDATDLLTQAETNK